MIDVTQVLRNLSVGLFPSAPVKVSYDQVVNLDPKTKSMLVHSITESAYFVPTQEAHFLSSLCKKLYKSTTYQSVISDLKKKYDKKVIHSDLDSLKENWLVPSIKGTATTKNVNLSKTTSLENISELTTKEVPISDCFVQLSISVKDAISISELLDKNCKAGLEEILEKYFIVADQEICKTINYKPSRPLFGEYWLKMVPGDETQSVLVSYNDTGHTDLILRFFSRCVQIPSDQY